jgi:Tetratricopeptide repeat
VYPDERVVRLVTSEFLPIRVHVRDPDDLYARLSGRLNVHWTPTVLTLDEDGVERHRIEGFLPIDDFLAHLKLGLGTAAFQRGAFDEAERWFREVVEKHPQSEPAPEALYWTGVTRYKGKGDASALADMARAFTTRYTDSAWAKKASVWRAA